MDPHGLAYIIPDDNGPLVDFDLVISESHTNTSTVTSHPVEKGVNVVDHVKPDPISLSLEVWVTNSPGGILEVYGGSFQFMQLYIPEQPPPSITQFFTNAVNAVSDAIFGPPPPPIIGTIVYPSPFDRVTDTHLALTAIERFGGTNTVVTSTKNYPDMILSSVGYEKSEGGCGSFKLEFKQIRVVSSSTVAAPAPIEPRGAPAKAKGSQATKDADAATAPKKSVLKGIKDAAKAAMGL